MTDASLLPAYGENVLLLATGSFLLALGLCWLGYVSLFSMPQSRQKLLAPMAPTTLLETLQELGSPNSIWFLRRLARTMDELVFRIPFLRSAAVVGDIRLIRRILQDVRADKPHELYGNFDKIVGSRTMFSSPSDGFWKLHRKALAPAFSNNEVHRMNQICTTHLERWCREFLDPLATAAEEAAATTSTNHNDHPPTTTTTTTFDPDYEVCCLTIRLIADSAFEYPISPDEIQQYMQDFNNAMREFMVKQLSNPLRYYFMWLLPDAREAQASALRMRALAQRMLEHYRQKKSTQEKKGTTDPVAKTFIHLIESHPDFSDQDKIAEIGSTLIGGFETTGTFLANTINHLAHNPLILQDLRADLEKVNYNPTESPYLQYVIKESYRLTPVAALGPLRMAPCDYSYDCQGSTCIVPKGAYVFMPDILPLHNAHVFPDPDKFDPKRWAKATPEMNEAASIMFSMGHRSCLGQALAIAEINGMLPQLVRQYDLVEVKPGTPDYFLTLKLVHAQIQPRKVPQKAAVATTTSTSSTNTTTKTTTTQSK